MAKPLPVLNIPPAAGGSGRPSDVPASLWDAIVKAATKNGVTPQVLAGIWRVESGSTYPNAAVNSSGYGGLFGTTKWNASTQEQANFAASTLRNLIAQKGNLHDALLAYSGNGYSTVPGVTVPTTPAQKAEDQARDARAKIASPDYVPATTDLAVIKSQAVAAAKATVHITDPWVVKVEKKGQITGFATSTGPNAPKNALLIGGQPATQSQAFGPGGLWTNRYDTIFQSFAGHAATPAEQAKILESGITPYALQQQLAAKPTFTSSPIFKANAAGIAGQAKKVLGVDPPKDFVTKAIAEDWSADTIAQNLRALPQYTKGPEYKSNFASNAGAFTQIMGTPDKNANAWLKTATLNGWDQTAVAGKLRSDPAYKYSPEYEAKAVSFLDAMGLFTGSRPVATLAKPKPDGDLNAPLPLTANLPGSPGITA